MTDDEVPDDIRAILDQVIEDHDLDADLAQEMLTRAKQLDDEEIDGSLKALLEGAIQ